MGRKREYTDKELLDRLRKADEELERFTSKNFDNLGYTPSRGTYVNRFGSFEKACLLANVDGCEYGMNQAMVDDVEEFIRSNKLYGYYQIREFNQLFREETNYTFSFTTMGRIVKRLSEKELDGLTIIVSNRNMYIRNEEAGYLKQVEEVREGYSNELKKWLFDSCLDLGKSLTGLQSGIFYLCNDVTQKEAGNRFGVTSQTVRNIVKAMKGKGLFDTGKGREFVDGFGCKDKILSGV